MLEHSTSKVMSALFKSEESPAGATSSIHQRATAASRLPPSLIVIIQYTNEHQREPVGDEEMLHQHRVHLVAHLLFDVLSPLQSGYEWPSFLTATYFLQSKTWIC